MDVRRLLKVYNYVNDDRKARVNVKFAAALAVFLFASIIGLAWGLAQNSSPSCPPRCDYETSREEYVGLDANEVATSGNPALLAQARLDEWQRDHPNYEVIEATPVEQGGVTIGFKVVYRVEPTSTA